MMLSGVQKPVRGLARLGLTTAEAAQHKLFERWLNVSTTGNVYRHDGVADSGKVFYEGCQWIPVSRALKRLVPTESDVFVDLGAGKGQGTLIAARLPYGRVIGVEVESELARLARNNIESARKRLRARRTDIVTADALDWDLPDETSVVFMYCPFIGELFRHVMGRIFDSYDRKPRSLALVYCYPFEHNWLVSSGRVAVEDVVPAKWPPPPSWSKSGWVIVTYRIREPNGAACDKPRRDTPALRRWDGPTDHQFWVAQPGEQKVYSQSCD
jgi:SAM-dependent methyltransferase